MSRLLTGLLTAVVLTTVVACSDVTNPVSNASAPVARLSGGSGGGGGGGGGGAVSGGGGTARPCAILTFAIVNNALLSTSVAPYWQPNNYYTAQAIGSTEKTCDVIPTAVMHFTDVTGTNDSCGATAPNFIGTTYAKYGTKPMSRFDQYFSYFTGDACVGSTRTIRADLYDSATGTILSSMTTTWIVG